MKNKISQIADFLFEIYLFGRLIVRIVYLFVRNDFKTGKLYIVNMINIYTEIEKIKNIKVIIAIGNPGKQYINTRHNAGYIILDRNIDKLKNICKYILKSDKFMNESGIYVSKILNYYKISPDELLIIHDDLDIKLGEFKLQFAKGPKVHNGLLSIIENIKTDKFWRLRIGIDSRDVNNKKYMSGAEYVLERFTENELSMLYKL